MSADGLTLSFRRGAEWLVTTRADSNASWSPPTADPLAEGLRRDYDLTPDGRTAFRPTVAPSKADPDQLVLNLLVWRRASWEAPFGDYVEERVGDGGQLAGLGTLSDDGRVYIFSQNVSAEGDVRHFCLFVATRTEWNMPWSAPVRLFGEEQSGTAGSPRLLSDGKTLLFVSDREGGQGRHDIWLARLSSISQF
jgi:hypothetical protein